MSSRLCTKVRCHLGLWRNSGGRFQGVKDQRRSGCRKGEADPGARQPASGFCAPMRPQKTLRTSTASTVLRQLPNRETMEEDVAMKSKPALAAETLLRGVRVQLENAKHDLRMLRATINRTKEAIRTSREAIVSTNPLLQPDEGFDTGVEAVGQLDFSQQAIPNTASGPYRSRPIEQQNLNSGLLPYEHRTKRSGETAAHDSQNDSRD